MGLRLIIGRSGSGKSHHCRAEIVRELSQSPLGPPIYLLVPRQAAFTAQRDIAASEGLPGFCRLEVMSFDQLAERLLTDLGGAAIPAVDAFGRQMIIGHLLRRHASELRFFSRSATQAGLPAKIEATLGEFQRAGRRPDDLAPLAARADVDPFAAKMADLALLYRAYEQFLGQERVDPRRRIAQVLAHMERAGCLTDARVFVDGFYDFAEPERRMLARLGRICRSVDVALLLDPQSPPAPGAILDDLSPLHRVEHACQALLKACADEGVVVDRPVLLTAQHRLGSPALDAVEHRLLHRSTTPVADAPNVCFVEAADRRQEVEHAALHIREMLAAGHRLRDIVVLVRSLDHYRDLIQAAFVEHDIPFFADRRRTMAHHPLVQLVRGVLAIALHRWPHEALMGVLKSGLAGLDPDEADELENYVLLHRLRGAVWARPEPWAWQRRLDADDDRLLAEQEAGRMDTLRRRLGEPVGRFMAAVESPHTVREHVAALFALLDELKVPVALGEVITAARQREAHELAGEHQQAWESLTGLFDQLIDLLGDEPASLEDFVSTVEAGLEQFDLALAPPTVDQVLVGQIDRTATGDIRTAMVLGLNEGIFPRAHRDESILTDAERLELRRRNFEIEPGSERMLLDERLLGYLAFTRASGSLYLSRTTADEAGRPSSPSVFWTELRALLPGAKVIELSHNLADTAQIASPRQLVNGITQWIRGGCDQACAAGWAYLYQHLARNLEQLPAALKRAVDAAWPALSYSNDARLSADTAARLFASPLSLSARQVETFASCQYRHFARYGLQLAERDESPLAEVNLDRAYHGVLERIVRQMLMSHQDWKTLDGKDADALAQQMADRMLGELHGEMLLGKGRSQYLLDRVRESLDRLLMAQQIIMKRSKLQTSRGTAVFGPDPAVLEPLVLQTPGQRTVMLHGRIDRVELIDSEKQAGFAVLDYRLAQQTLQLWQVREGLALQLLTQLLAIQANAGKLAEKELTPVGAFCVKVLATLDEYRHPDEIPEASDPRYYLRQPMRGVYRRDFLDRLDTRLQAGESSPVVSAKLNKNRQPGNKNNTDFVEPDELAGLLELTRQTLVRLADRLADGEIAVHPYRIGTAVPCSTCAYRAVCRFDPSINRYNTLKKQAREDLLSALRPARQRGPG